MGLGEGEAHHLERLYACDGDARLLPLAEGAAYEAALFGLAAATDDMREGTRAFLEKRKPAFKGQ